MSKFRIHRSKVPDGPLCNGKVTHVTGAKAWAEAAKVNGRRNGRPKQDGAPVRPYRCPDCGCYHLGRP